MGFESNLLQKDPVEVMRSILGTPPAPAATMGAQNIAQAQPLLANMNPGGAAPGAPAGMVPPAAPAAPAAAPALVSPAQQRLTLPTAPQLDPHRAELVQQRTQAAAPLDPNKYKPNMWARILGIIGAGLTGNQQGLRNIMSMKYDKARDQQQQQVAGLDTEINRSDDEFNQKERVYNTQMRGYEAQERNDERAQANQWRKEDRERDDQREANQPINGLAPIRVDKDAMTGAKRYYYKTKGGGEVEGGPPGKDAALEEQVTHDRNMEAIERDKIAAGREKSEGSSSKPKRGTPEQFKDVDVVKDKDLKKASTDYESDALLDPKGAGAKRERAEMEAELKYAKSVRDLGGDYKSPAFGGKTGYNWSPAVQGEFQEKVAALQKQSSGGDQPGRPQGSGSGKVLDRTKAAEYLQKAKGDKDQARKLAQNDGWEIPKTKGQ